MATIAIQVGIAVGGMILQSLLTPKVKQEPIDKGKFDDIRIQGSEYGAFIPRGWGKFRTAGNIVFSSGIDHEIVSTPSQGGKGVPSAPATRTHIYRTDAGILFCRGELESFGRIWADADLLTNDNGEPTEEFLHAESATLGGGAAIPTLITDGDFAPPASNNGVRYPSAANGHATFTSATPAPLVPPEPNIPVPYTRLSVFYKSSADINITVTLDTGSITDTIINSSGDYSVQTLLIPGHTSSVKIAKTTSGSTLDLDKIGLYQYYETEDYPEQFNNISQAINPTIVYPLDLNDPSEYYNYKQDYTDGEKSFATTNTAAVRLYLGTEDQTQDAAIMAWLDSRFGAGQGVVRTSAMLGLAYIMFDNRLLRQGRLENFTAECIQSSTAVSVDTIIEDIGADVGLSASDFTHETNPPRSVTGFLVNSAQSRRTILEPLLNWSHRRMADIDGKILVSYVGPIGSVWDPINEASYTYTADYTIDNDLDLRAHAYGSETPSHDMEINRDEPALKPQQVRASFMNPALEYHNDTADSEPIYTSEALDIVDYAFPIVASVPEAKTVANEIHRTLTMADAKFTWSGTPNMAKYTVGDVIQVVLNSVTYTVRIEEVNRQIPHGVINYMGIRTEELTIGSDPSYAPEFPDNVAPIVSPNRFAFPKYPRNSIVIPIESAPIREQDKGKLGIYLAVSGRGRGHWENAALYREYAADNFIFEKIIDAATPIGVGIKGALATHSPVSSEDTTNSLEIHFYDDVELESVTSGELAAFPTLNLIRIGDEWVQFRTAVAASLDAGSIYRSAWTISNLMRGRFGTDGAVGGHATDEHCSLVTKALQFYELDTDDVGEDIVFKAKTAGQALENAPTATHSAFGGVVSDWTVTNSAVDRTFDANNTSFDELADVINTILIDTKLK